MSEQSLVVQKEGFFKKITNFFKSLFGRNIIEDTSDIFYNNTAYNEKSYTNKDNIFGQSNDLKKEEFAKQFDGDVDKLKMLSKDRLKKLSEYYDEVIKKNEEEILRLSNTSDNKENFVKQFEGNIDKLKMLSKDRLQELIKYYNSIIEKNEDFIKKLKNKAA